VGAEHRVRVRQSQHENDRGQREDGNGAPMHRP
jgi:hypothetical protein